MSVTNLRFGGYWCRREKPVEIVAAGRNRTLMKNLVRFPLMTQSSHIFCCNYSMRLDKDVDAKIRSSLQQHGINVALDSDDRILVHEYRMDPKAKAGMLYLRPKDQVPNGELPFLVTGGRGVYGVFHLDGEAVIIEVGFAAMDEEVSDE